MGITLTLVFVLLGGWLVNLAYKQLDFYLRLGQAQRSHGAQLPPSYPHKIPVKGIDLIVHLDRAEKEGVRSDEYLRLHRKYGQTFYHNHLMGPTIRTAQPEVIQALSATQFDKFGVFILSNGVGQPFIGEGVFTVDGLGWKRARGAIRPSFTRVEIANLDSFEEYVAKFLEILPKDGTTFDIQPILKRLYMDVSTEFLFGESTRSLFDDSPEHVTKFIQAFDEALTGLNLRIVVGPLLRPILNSLDLTWRKAYDQVHAFIDRRVQISLEKSREETIEKKDNNGRPRKYILLDEIAQEVSDPLALRNQIMNVFFAARDTTALIFSNVLFFLCRQPHYWDKLREEVNAIPETQALTFELLKSLKWTKAILNETLRLRMAAGRGIRIAKEDVIVSKGGGPDNQSPLFIPKGYLVEYDMHVMHRNPEFWGPDSEEFKPERWLDKDRPLWEAKWQYSPYHGGSRMCPAQQQTLTQMAYLLVRMAQEITSIACRDDDLEYKEIYRMTVESRNGVKMAIWE